MPNDDFDFKSESLIDDTYEQIKKVDQLISQYIEQLNRQEQRNEPYLKSGMFSKIRQLSEVKLNLMQSYKILREDIRQEELNEMKIIEYKRNLGINDTDHQMTDLEMQILAITPYIDNFSRLNASNAEQMQEFLNFLISQLQERKVLDK